MIEFRVLGSVNVIADGVPLTAQPRQRALLAALLVDAGRMVTTGTLINRVWGDTPPSGTKDALYGHASRLRKLLRAAGAGEPAAVDVVSQSGGYLLRVDPDRVDLHRFRDRVARARDADDDPPRRVALLREGLAQWQGEPLSGLGSPWAERMRETWRYERIGAVTAWADAELAVQNAAAAVAPLTDLTAEYPLVEPVTAVLMRVLYALGRPADALDRYADLRRRLAEELGADPSPDLRELHTAILRGTLAPSAGPVTSLVTGRAAPVPEQLPADVAAFTGRGAELDRLDSLLAATAGDGLSPDGPEVAGDGGVAPLVISAVAGAAGVGKTALAVRWAHRTRHRFPDGQLYVNLRGYDPEQPMTAAEALAGFLADLGVPAADMPLGEADRASRFRSVTAGRHLLILLDNAASVEQVRPLLPGSSSCTVVVTSRDSLAGLVVLHGARRLELDALPQADAITLLHRLIGDRVDTEPGAAAALADRCDRLPLALRIAAEVAAARPARPLAELVRDLADQRRRLELLDAGGDPRAALVPVFSWSLRRLPPDTAQVFELLGLHPGPDFDGYAAAALTGTSLDAAQRALDQLTRAHLVEAAEPGRYGLHDLLHAYAASLAVAAEPGRARSAQGRLYDYYLGATSVAMDQLYPAERHRRPRVPPPATPVPPLADPDTALRWLDAELRCLVTVSAQTAGDGWPGHTVRLSSVLFRYLDGGHYTDALTIHGHALTAAQRTGDLAGQAQSRHALATANLRLGRHDTADGYFEQALALFRETGDQLGQARTLNNLGTAHMQVGRHGPAAAHFEQALRLYREVGDSTGEARTLGSLGVVYGRQGQLARAERQQEQALALCRRSGDRTGEAWALASLGDVAERLGRYERAAEHHRQALELYQRLGNRYGEAWARDSLGTVHSRLGRPAEGLAYHQRALDLFQDIGDTDGEAWALNGLGEAYRDAGRTAEALARHAAAHRIAEQSHVRDQHARAHAGLGRTHRVLGDGDEARRHLGNALRLYTELGMPEADQVRADLDDLAALDGPAALDDLGYPGDPGDLGGNGAAVRRTGPPHSVDH